MDVSRTTYGSLATAILACLLFAQTGCSFVFVDPAPSTAQWDVPGPKQNCTSAEVAPVIDTILAIGDGSAATWALLMPPAGEPGSPYQSSSVRTGAIIGGLAGGLLWTISAIYGYSNTGKCHRYLAYSPRPSRYNATSQAASTTSSQSNRSAASNETMTEPDASKAENCQTGTICTSDGACLSDEICHDEINQCVRVNCVTGNLAGNVTAHLVDRGEEVAVRFQARNEVMANQKGSSDEESDQSATAEDIENKLTLSVPEAADACGVEESLIRSWIESGDLEALEVQDGYRISRSELAQTWKAKGGGDLFTDE